MSPMAHRRGATASTSAGWPPIIGSPAGSLLDASAASWAGDAAAAGARGEMRTAEVLATFAARGGPTVIHDLNIPIVGNPGNIDHVVVTGRDVWLVDSKLWLPGTYWTWRGVTRRGRTLFPPADKRFMGFAAAAVSQYLGRLKVSAKVRTPLIVVWPSRRTGRVALWPYRPRDARVVPGPALATTARRLFSGAAADPRVVSALAALARSSPATRNQPNPSSPGFVSAADAGWESTTPP